MNEAATAGLAPRRAAWRLLEMVSQGRPFDQALTEALRNLPEADRRLAHELAADAVELHTGKYALAKRGRQQERELIALVQAGAIARQLGMALHAGHGLNYQNVRPVATIEDMRELNIGHAIVSRAVMVGMEQAVREMKRLIE